MVHGYYQIEITIHSHLFLSHQPLYSISTKFTATRHPIPHLYWKSRILTAVVFSVKFGLIGAVLSLHFNRGVKRLQPERVIACSLPFLRNELKERALISPLQRKCAEDLGHEAALDTYRAEGPGFYSNENFQCEICN